MEKSRFESFEAFSCLKKVNPRILSPFKRSFSKKMVKKASSYIIHSQGGEYVTLHRNLMLKVKARARHACTTRLHDTLSVP